MPCQVALCPAVVLARREVHVFRHFERRQVNALPGVVGTIERKTVLRIFEAFRFKDFRFGRRVSVRR